MAAPAITLLVDDPMKASPAELALQLAYFAGWLHSASINAEVKAALLSLLLAAAKRLAVEEAR